MSDDNLAARQEAASQVERRMREFLLQFVPADALKVGDVKCIAFEARSLAFDEFDKAERARIR